MSLRLALIRSLEGIDTYNDDDNNGNKNEEKKKHQRKIKKKTPIVELPKIDKCVRNDDPSKVSNYIMRIYINCNADMIEVVHMICVKICKVVHMLCLVSKICQLNTLLPPLFLCRLMNTALLNYQTYYPKV